MINVFRISNAPRTGNPLPTRVQRQYILDFSASLPVKCSKPLGELMDTFEIGDKVVYPNHGVGIIEKISNRLVAGKFERFYLLRICSNDILVMVPTANASDVGLRKIIDRRDVDQLLSFLSSNQFFTQKDWKDRFKENSEKMRSGSIFHVAEVFKNLVYLSRVKPLSFREKRMLDRARFLLISELSTVMNISEMEIEDRIEKAVTKACGKVPVA
jgi:CarD family transcriptional regulator, regulator of rRNA transcription